MQTKPLALNLEGVSEEDWQDTRASVKQLLLALMAEVAELKGRVSRLEEENHCLREQLAGNSGNSSLPPSSDGPGAMAERVKKHPSGRKRGAQKGRRGHKRKLYLLERCAQVMDHHPERGEKTARAKTARTSQALLKMEAALWLFVTQEGVEPTNNAAERAIRPAVIWRRISFGSQSATGSEFVARMLSVVTTLRQQDRDVLAYLTEACQAARQGKAAPSLLPRVAEAEDRLPIAA